MSSVSRVGWLLGSNMRVFGATRQSTLASSGQIRFNCSSIQRLKKLRDETGSPIAQVKKALDEFEGDFDKAKKFLIEKGLASAQKMLKKETREGVVALNVDNSRQYAVLSEVNCETDFVARSDLFLAFVNAVLVNVIENKPKIAFLSNHDQDAVLSYLN